MELEIKYICNVSHEYILNIIKRFNITTILNHEDNQSIIEFYDTNKIIIGFINYEEIPNNNVYNGNNLLIKSIYYLDDKYLDAMIKKLVKKTYRKFICIYININDKLLDENIIFALKKNNFKGNNTLFL